MNSSDNQRHGTRPRASLLAVAPLTVVGAGDRARFGFAFQTHTPIQHPWERNSGLMVLYIFFSPKGANLHHLHASGTPPRLNYVFKTQKHKQRMR